MSTSLAFLHAHATSDNNPLPPPFSIVVSFDGSIPEHLQLPLDLPLEVTVKLPDSFTPHLKPVLKICPLAGRDSEAQMSQHSIPLLLTGIPFLPLRPDFDYTKAEHWAALLFKVEKWLLVDLKNKRFAPKLWAWGLDAYWMCFMGVNPGFPHGDWQRWNSKIAMEGQFIKEWMLREQQSETVSVLASLWMKFGGLLGSIPSDDALPTLSSNTR